MKIQWKILLFIVCLNLAVGMTIALQLPGTEYVYPSDPGGTQQDAASYEEHFNATDIANRWGASYVSGIPIVGDIMAAFQFFVLNWQYLLDGFPTFINWCADTFLTDAFSRISFFVIANAFRAVYGILMCMLFIEFIGGRILSD